MNGEFLLTTLVVVAAPGTGAIYTVAIGVSGGFRAGLVAAFGCTLGIVPHMVAAISGVATLMHTSGAAFRALQCAGVAYLLFMAWSMLRDRAPLRIRSYGSDFAARDVVGKAILLNLLNPKLSVFFLAFLPQFVGAHEQDPAVRMILLGLVFMAVTFIVFAAYGAVASALGPSALASTAARRWIPRTFASAFAALALHLAFAGR